MIITRAKLKAFAPNAKPELLDAIARGWPAATDAGIEANTKRLHGFLASIATETGGLARVEESLNYTTPARLRAIFGKYITSAEMAAQYVRQPKKLAILVYGGRLGNAKGPSTDGWDYRGGGMMQTTGRTNYRKLGFEDRPDDLRDPDIAFETAVAEWVNRGCNAIADGGDLKKLRRSINGGLNGFAEFQEWVAKAARVWPTVGTARPAEDEPSDKDTITGVQIRLKELGYTEVGEVDGKLGKMTKTAILAFRNENDLPLSPEIDGALLAALGPQAKSRELAAARVEAKPSEVRAQVPEAKAAWWTQLGAWVLGIPAAVGTAVSGVFDNLDGSRGVLEPIKDFAGDIPPWVWFASVGAVALFFWWRGRQGTAASTEAFQTGGRR